MNENYFKTYVNTQANYAALAELEAFFLQLKTNDFFVVDTEQDNY